MNFYPQKNFWPCFDGKDWQLFSINSWPNIDAVRFPNVASESPVNPTNFTSKMSSSPTSLSSTIPWSNQVESMGDNNKNGCKSLWYGGNRFSNKNSSYESVAFFGSNSLLTVSHAYDISCESLNYSTHSSSKKLSCNSLRRCVYFNSEFLIGHTVAKVNWERYWKETTSTSPW